MEEPAQHGGGLFGLCSTNPQQGSLKDTCCPGVFHQNKGHHHLQGNVQVYNVRIPAQHKPTCSIESPRRTKATRSFATTPGEPREALVGLVGLDPTEPPAPRTTMGTDPKKKPGYTSIWTCMIMQHDKPIERIMSPHDRVE